MNNLIKIDGFIGNAIHSGVKKEKLDLSIIYSDIPCISAGVFTQNKSCAAPVIISKENIENPIQAIVVNSGNANACTGEEGLKNAKLMCEKVATQLNLDPSTVLIASTGIIGKQLEMNKILPGIEKTCNDLTVNHLEKVPTGIHTTDKIDKVETRQFELDGETICINGFAKGSGMIHPNMATMLGFFLTNINMTKELFQSLLKEITDDTFNMISVDGDTSTNDMVIGLSNQKADHPLITSPENEGYKLFKQELFELLKNLAIKIAKDGEGATKLITSKVIGAKNKQEARMAAKSIIESNLTKSAFYGESLNWGRIACALGYSGSDYDLNAITIKLTDTIDTITFFKNGVEFAYDETIGKKIISSENPIVLINLNTGNAKATAWGCDLTEEYVKINVQYG